MEMLYRLSYVGKKAGDESRTRGDHKGSRRPSFRILGMSLPSHSPCSLFTTQLFKSGRRVSNSRPSAWKADALPTELLPLNSFYLIFNLGKTSSHNYLLTHLNNIKYGERRIRTFEGERRQIYSLLPLATREPHHFLEPTIGLEPTTY